MPLPIGSPAKALKSLVAPAWSLVQTARGGRVREPIRSFSSRSACDAPGHGKIASPYIAAAASTDLRAAVLASWHGPPATAGSRGRQRRGRVAVKDTVRARPAFSVDGASNTIQS